MDRGFDKGAVCDVESWKTKKGRPRKAFRGSAPPTPWVRDCVAGVSDLFSAISVPGGGGSCSMLDGIHDVVR